MESKLIKTIFFASVVWLAGAILTQDAWGADTVVYALRAGGAVGTLDLNTGVFSQVTSTPVPTVGFGEYAGVLYGANGGCDCLFQFNPATAATTIAPQTFNQVDNGVANGFGALNGLGSTTAGLFVIGAGSSDILYSVDPATGHPTRIGDTGVIAGGGTGTLSASVDSSQLYWEVQINCTDTLYSINTSTGAATTIGSVQACFPSPTGNPTALVFTGGTLWANFYTYGFGTISTSSGAQHLVSTSTQPTFAAFAPFPLIPPTPVLVGSMGHIAAEENWTSTFTLVNKGVAPSQAVLSFFGDATGPTGDGPLTLPLIFPQVSTTAITTASSVTRSMAANASLIVQTAGPQTPPVLVGSAQLAAAGLVDGFAIFHQIPTAQEAVVPMETRNASSYLLAFDNTGGIALGVAVENVATSDGNVGVIIRDDKGLPLTTGSLAVSASGHTSFVLATQYPVTDGKRGTIEFDTPPGGQISVVGIRFTPPNNALTSIPALANVGTAGGSIAHIATGNGWQTTFVLVNTGTTLAPVTLKFFADLTGGPLTIPVSFPQIPGGTVSLVSSVSQPLNPGATLVIQSAAPLANPTPTVGSAQVTTTGNVSGFVIFRYNPNGQEAVAPLESRIANSFLVPFDNTDNTATGIAVNSVSLQTMNVPVIVRDDTGAQIATDTITLPPNAHVAFTLVTDKYPQTANIRGTVEFGTPPGGQIGALGIRIPTAHTFTTLPALAR